MRKGPLVLTLAALVAAVSSPNVQATRPGGSDCESIFPGGELSVRYLIKLEPASGPRATPPAQWDLVASKARRMGAQLSLVRQAASGFAVVELRGATPTDVRKLAGNLSKEQEIEFLVEDQTFEATFVPNDTDYSKQWAMYPTPQGTGASQAWARSQNGADTVVAVLDTGYTPHPDLDANRLPGYDFISDVTSAGDGNGRDADPTDNGSGFVNGCGLRPSSWHGTAIAGIIAAVGNNQAGVIGAAYGTKVMPVRVLGKQGGSRSDIADAIVWAAGGHVPGIPDNSNPVEVINLSLRLTPTSSTVCEQPERTAIQFAIDRGVVVVAGVGNDNLSASLVSPASCPGVIAVGASDQTGGKASFSNHGPAVTLLAPGVDLFTTSNTGVLVAQLPTYQWVSGTSMAAPMVSAAAAMIQSIRPRTPQQVKELLVATAKPLTSACPNGCGAGLLDIDAATLAAASEPTAAFDTVMVKGPNCPNSNLATYQLIDRSQDPNGDIVDYQWFKNGVLYSTSPSPPSVQISSTTSIRLVVTDATGWTNEISSELVGFRCLH